MDFYNEDGEKVEGVISPEEAAQLQEKAAKYTELEVTLAEKEEAIQKLSQKDLNFKKFRTLTEAERQEEMKGWSEEKRFYMQEIENLHGKMEKFSDASVGTVKEDKIKALVGDDKDLRKELEEQYTRLGTEAVTKEQIIDQLDEAHLILQHRKDRVNRIDPLNSYVPSTRGQGFSDKKTDFADTEDGKQLAKELGLKLEEPKK